jgi:SAM-dependent methyltransferase
MPFTSKMTSDDYPEGYWERGEGSNYHNYSDEVAWPVVLDSMYPFIGPQIREVACAKGFFVYHALKRGFDAKGFDISRYAISHMPTPELAPYIQVANAVDMPWDDDEADTLFAFEFMEHVYEDELDRVIEEMSRVTIKGGKIILKIGLAGMDDHIEDDHTHYTQHERSWWEGVLGSTGWTRKPNLENRLDLSVSKVQPTWSGRWFVYEV